MSRPDAAALDWHFPSAVTRTATNLRDWLTGLTRASRPAPCGLPLVAELAPFLLTSAAIVLIIAATMAFIDAPLNKLAGAMPPIGRWSFKHITDFGKSGWFLYPLGMFVLVAAACSSPSLGRMANYVLISLVVRAGFLFLAIGVPGLIVTIGKRLIGRVRPSEAGPFAYEPLSWKAAYASLPSGHATTAFAAAVAVGALWPKARPLIWSYAVLIGASRIMVHAHYASDILAGAAAGALGAIVVRNWFALRRLGFVIATDGSVRPMPTPSLQRVKRVARRVLGY